MDDEQSFQVGEVCPNCKELGEENHLRYFFINCDDRIIKCESNKCIFPYAFDDEDDEEDAIDPINDSALNPNVKNETDTSTETNAADALNNLLNEINFDFKELETPSCGDVCSPNTEIPPMLGKEKVEKIYDEIKQNDFINPEAKYSDQNDVKITNVNVNGAESFSFTQLPGGLNTSNLPKKDFSTTENHDTTVMGAGTPIAIQKGSRSKSSDLSKNDSSTIIISDQNVEGSQTENSMQLPRSSSKTTHVSKKDSLSTKTVDKAQPKHSLQVIRRPSKTTVVKKKNYSTKKNNENDLCGVETVDSKELRRLTSKTMELCKKDPSVSSNTEKKTKVANYLQNINALELTTKKERFRQPSKKPSIVKSEKPSNEEKLVKSSSISSLDEIRKLVQHS